MFQPAIDLGVTVTGILSFTILHAVSTMSDLFVALDYFKEMIAPQEMLIPQRQVDQQRRFEDQLLQTRLRMLTFFNKVGIQLAFLFAVTAVWRLMQHPTYQPCFELIASLIGYVGHVFAEGNVTTSRHFRYVTFTFSCTHFMYSMGVAWETNLVVFLCQEKLCVLFLFLLAVVLIDLKVVLTLYICESAVFTIRFWFLIGFEKLTSIIIVTTLTCHFVVAISLVLIIHNIRSNIAARQNSGSASSLMLGFRHVLRGVCDGDFLLDRSSCSILDDASCLERLLKSKKKLSESNFLDLFMDAESRLNFLNFLNAQDPSEMSTIPRIPRGLRVSLQGADGPVSLDLFHTRIPSQDSAGDYCLLAMKEDPEQKPPPDASEAGARALPRSFLSTAPSCTRSSETEIVDTCEELMEIALLFTNETGLLDVKEVRLSFHRQSWAPTMESGMPTLRRFIRPTDWDRIETMIQNVVNLPPSEIERRCYFRHPMLFRVPGASRSYMCSRQTYITLHCPQVMDDPERPIFFRMHLSSFDANHIARPREQELGGIEESVEEEGGIEEGQTTETTDDET
ncbi:unnamed protein product [Cladocopium goreaui]|uniref:Transmembrane protein n=1 Tax=Cladocopium goreaui TaxID=2562237 RepID=A0A9P1DSL5_9DINO|nr:unnamed protein product [Cladocopium goreaui]